ncbi:MAG: 16S rRNA (guanine(527)-N(7))-methyltransferase RsmG [Lachnospiraceae bacterium]|nr:16S rRNA (guanine(527)-N(7))-methyltransferase RsmG [Lachnospiraceae bacterium]
MRDNRLLRSSLDILGIAYTEEQLLQFERYYDLLIEWNNKINLTAITDYDDVIIKHFIDSVLICRDIKFSSGNKMIDVGTGAGFPGIPLKILNPQLSVTLLDSLNKRIGFLNEVVNELGLKDIICIHGRAEDVSREKSFRGQFDLSVSRAVANLSTLSEYCIPFLRQGGRFISYKSDKSDDEIESCTNALRCFNSGIVEIKNIPLPGSDIVRKFIIIESKGPVNNKYPRKAGIPQKDPL